MSDPMKALNVLMNPSKKTLVNTIMEEAIKLTGSSLGYFAVMNDEENELTMLAWSKSAMKACSVIDRPFTYPLEQTGLWGDCIRERKAVITNDYEDSTRATKRGYPAGHVHIIRHMNVPIHGNGRLAGILGVGNKETDYTREDAEALQKFADDTWRVFKKSK